ncbi:MAG: hypothetical protein DWH91_13910 [Planctomycetota bacterium]|nr:MAG: hypothetical protein DWH91_13910 [Planctomycetota bacterium]
MALLVFSFLVVVLIWLEAGPDSAEELRQIEQLIRRGDYVAAEKLATDAIVHFPENPEFAWLAAVSAAQADHAEEAFRWTEQVPQGTPRHLDAARLRAKLAEDPLHRLRDAELAGLSILQQSPGDLRTHELLAKQYGLTARRFEAIPHVLEMIRGGEETDLILLLGRERGIIQDDEKLRRARMALPDDPRPVLGQAWHAINEERHADAELLLKEALRLGPELPATWAAWGRWLADRKSIGPWREWVTTCPASAEVHPDVWRARGEWADTQSDKDAALRCYWECVRRSPETRPATMRFAQLLADAGQTEPARRCQVYLEQLLALETAQDRAFSSQAGGDLGSLLGLVKRYHDAGRLWEALALCRLAAAMNPNQSAAAEQLSVLTRDTVNLPLTLTAPQWNPATGLDFSALPLPGIETRENPHSEGKHAASTLISFDEQSTAAQLHFRYEDGARGPRRLMHEITGGGIAFLDYDIDGFPDVFCSQGGTQPPLYPTDRSDQLFRNQNGVRFENRSTPAGIQEQGFGQGVSVGDLNSDGFPDLFVGNIGENALWINQGDGTFVEASSDWGLQGAVWTTSSVIADLNQDGHPDLYEVNYLQGNQLFERICKHADGSDSQCMPFDFEAEPDRVWINSGAGQWVDGKAILSRVADGKGLGVVAWRPALAEKLCVFVANDTTPNFLWIPRQQNGHWQLEEQGILAGVALSQDGKPQGSMGIAVGDVDQDQRFDLCVSNFLAESFAIYRAKDDLNFQDQARETGLRELTLNRLGFGTQFFDADCDGQLELFLANGHIQDLSRLGRPYRMPPLFCAWNGERFEEIHPPSLGKYFQSEWLARAAAVGDWNQDGLLDLLVSHLDDTTKLLTNTSPATRGSLSLRLVARDSARDAVGTIVTIRCGERRWVRQLIGGGGYQATNESSIAWGLSSARQIDELVIDWPSGRQQRMTNLQLPFRGIAIEGRERVMSFTPSSNAE